MAKKTSSLRVTRGGSSLSLHNDLFECVFTDETGGFPARISYTGYERPVVNNRGPMMRATLADSGEEIRPVLTEFKPEVFREGDAVHVLFNQIAWQTRKGALVPGYRLALRYEFNQDGIVFVRTFFCVETPGEEKIKDFILEPGIELGPRERANWAYWKYPDSVDARLIQNFGGVERFLKQGEQRTCHYPAPLVSFDFGEGDRRDHHFEYFVESNNSLSTPYKNGNSATDIYWEKNRVKVRWNFQKEPAKLERRAYYWRNIWGWGIRRWQTERKHPPFREYHYLDLKKRYPSSETIRQAAAEGANLFVCHENWRLDFKNGDFPHSVQAMTDMVRSLHRHGIRFCPYVRGNEDNIRESGGRALAPWIKPDWDGIYMDYGSPICYQAPEEFAPGSRIHFYEQYQAAKRVRQLVGDRGVYTSHSGSFFCATAHTFCDAYVGGEQEKGKLLDSQEAYSYFSGLSVVPPALWTAAFPTYRSARALPFLATSLSTPFLALGTQFPRSSLDITQYPHQVRFARPLWRLYELFDGKQDILTHSTYYSRSPIRTNSKETGVSVMVSRKNEILVIASNFSSKKRRVEFEIDWKKMGVTVGKTGYALSPGYESCSYEEIKTPAKFSRELPGYGLAGWLLVPKPGQMRKAVEHFARPYPMNAELDRMHTAELEKIRKNRFEPPAWKEAYLQLSLPANVDTFEHSIFYDLYVNFVELWDLTGKKQPVRLGYIGKNGFSNTIPTEKEYILPGDSSVWIPLHNILKGAGGRRHLALGTRRGEKGEYEFYHFYFVHLSPKPKMTEDTYEVVYTGEIDSDWSKVDFVVDIKPH